MNDSGDALQRRLGRTAAMAIVVANVVGTGVFLKAGIMTQLLGSPAWVIAAWVAAGLLSLAGALTYAELASRLPHTGGEFAYLRHGFGRIWAFLFGWTQILVAKTGSQAAAATAFGIFLNDLCGNRFSGTAVHLPLFGTTVGISWIQLIAVALIAVVTVLNTASVKFGGRIATALALTKLGLIVLVGAGAFCLAAGSWGHFQMTAPISAGGGFAAAMLAALWAYDGWNTVTLVAGEVENPRRNLPLALIGGIAAIMVLYLLANLAYYFVLTPAEVAAVPKSSSVARETAVRFLGSGAAGVMTVGLLLSSLGTLHTSILAGARIPYAMARHGMLWRFFGQASPGTATPIRALMFQGFWACLLALSGTFDRLTDYVVFGSLIFYGLAGAAVFTLRRKDPHNDTPKSWGYPAVPILYLLSTLYLLLETLRSGQQAAVFGLGIIATGLPVYWFIKRGYRNDRRDCDP